MTDRNVDILIIGGGLAGASCAEGLRESGFDGSVLLVGREPHPPYQRPPITKDMLRGESEPEEAHLFADEWYAEHDVELLTRTSVMKLDPSAKTATLSHKQAVSFDRALIATGANINRLRVEGGDHDGIHYLRTLGTGESLRSDAADAEKVVIVGGSYIACEAAASLTVLGKQCTLVMPEDGPLALGFGKAASGYFAGLLGSHGIEFVTGDGVTSFEGAQRVERVVTESGKKLDADLVVIGIGAHPDVMLARAARRELGESGGVKCSSTLETSAAGIWCAGDPCEYDSVVHRRRLRVEHFEVAAAQGKYAAAAMAGTADGPYDEVPYFWSDLADWTSLEYVGPAAQWDREVVLGSFDDGEFTVFYLDGAQVAGALTVGRSDDLEHAKRLMTAHTDVDAEALASGTLESL